MKAFFIGSRDYVRTLRLQEAVFDQKIKRQITVLRGESTLPLLPDVTLLVEHSQPVYTLGRRDTADGLPTRNAIQVVNTKRGGGITYHGPGQITVYPLANIRELWRGCTSEGRPRSPIEWFSAVLESMMIDTANHYGIPAHAYKTGVWADATPDKRAEKLGSIGLQLGSWVSMHGASLNVDPDLAHFSRIVMCELPGESASSLGKEIRHRHIPRPVPSVLEVCPVVLDALGRHLNQADRSATIEPLIDLSTDDNWDKSVLRMSGYSAAL